jgi:hypothetical protein
MSREILGPSDGAVADAMADALAGHLGDTGPDVPTRVISLREVSAASPPQPRSDSEHVAAPPGEGRVDGGVDGRDGSADDGRDEKGERRGGRRVSPRTAVLAAGALAGGALLGWTGSGNWTAPAPAPADATLAAVVQSMERADGRDAPSIRSSDEAWRLSARIWLTNLSTSPVTLLGTGNAPLAAQATIRDLPLTVLPGADRQITASVVLVCSSPQQLDLQPLQVRRGNGPTRPVRLLGAAAALAHACATTTPRRVISSTAALLDEERLRVDLTVTGGRTIRLVAVRAGGTELTGRPLPAQLDGQLRSIWLNPPASCPTSWQRAGIPRSLDLTLEGGTDLGSGVTRTHDSVLVGDSLAAWLLGSGCADR